MSEGTRKYLIVVIAVTVLFGLVDVIWLPLSSVDFSPSNWLDIAKVAACLAAIWGTAEFVLFRLRIDRSFIASGIRYASKSLLILAGSAAAFIPLGIATGVFMVLASATSRPLLDADLAAIDAALRFDWLGFVGTLNQSAIISSVLVFAYHALGPQVPIVLACHAARQRSDRAWEFLALMAVSSIFIAPMLAAVPAAGAYPFHNPPAETFSNFSAHAGVWHIPVLQALRSGAPFELIMTKGVGLVTFPSFHAALGIMVVYALRDVRCLLWLALVVNAVMIVSTLPEGGHYLIDVIGGIAVALVSIACVRALTAERSRVVMARTGRAANQLRG